MNTKWFEDKMKLVNLVLVCFIALEEALISSARTDFINGKMHIFFLIFSLFRLKQGKKAFTLKCEQRQAMWMLGYANAK